LRHEVVGDGAGGGASHAGGGGQFSGASVSTGASVSAGASVSTGASVTVGMSTGTMPESTGTSASSGHARSSTKASRGAAVLASTRGVVVVAVSPHAESKGTRSKKGRSCIQRNVNPMQRLCVKRGRGRDADR
jgi:hypothetical protein